MKIYQRINLYGPWSTRKGMEIYDDDGNELEDVVTVDCLGENRVRLTHQQEVDHDDVEIIILKEDEKLPSEKLDNIHALSRIHSEKRGALEPWMLEALDEAIGELADLRLRNKSLEDQLRPSQYSVPIPYFVQMPARVEVVGVEEGEGDE